MAVALLFGSIVLFLWHQEMFSDGHVGRFSRQSNAERPKNITALVAPAIGCMSLSVGFCALSAFVTSYSDPPVEEPSGFWMYWDTFWGALILISLIVAAIGFIPLPLPRRSGRSGAGGKPTSAQEGVDRADGWRLPRRPVLNENIRGIL